MIHRARAPIATRAINLSAQHQWQPLFRLFGFAVDDRICLKTFGRWSLPTFTGWARFAKRRQSEGRLRFRKRPSYVMAVSRILSADFSNRDDHLSSSPSFVGELISLFISGNKTGAGPVELSFSLVRRYPRINPERLRGIRAGCPPSVLSCTAWGFSCLANYSASGELLPRLFNLTCSFLKEPAVSFL